MPPLPPVLQSPQQASSWESSWATIMGIRHGNHHERRHQFTIVGASLPSIGISHHFRPIGLDAKASLLMFFGTFAVCSHPPSLKTNQGGENNGTVCIFLPIYAPLTNQGGHLERMWPSTRWAHPSVCVVLIGKLPTRTGSI